MHLAATPAVNASKSDHPLTALLHIASSVNPVTNRSVT
jgi:hypothetical protein